MSSLEKTNIRDIRQLYIEIRTGILRNNLHDVVKNLIEMTDIDKNVFEEILLVIVEYFKHYNNEQMLNFLIKKSTESINNLICSIYGIASFSINNKLNKDTKEFLNLIVNEIANKIEKTNYTGEFQLLKWNLDDDILKLLALNLIDLIDIINEKMLVFTLKIRKIATNSFKYFKVKEQNFEKILRNVDCKLFQNLFDQMNKNDFLKLISIDEMIIPKFIASKLCSFDNVDYFIKVLEEPHLFLDEDKIKNYLLSIKNDDNIIEILKPKLKNSVLSSPSFWHKIINFTDKKNFVHLATCFINNSDNVSESAAKFLEEGSVTNENTCLFLKTLLVDENDLLDFLLSSTVNNILINLKTQPITLFWNLFTCETPFYRIRGILNGKFPFAFHGLIYALVNQNKIDDFYTKKLNVPEINKNDIKDILDFLTKKDIVTIDDIFQPFTDSFNAIQFFALAQFFGFSTAIRRKKNYVFNSERFSLRDEIKYDGLTPDNILLFLIISLKSKLIYHRKNMLNLSDLFSCFPDYFFNLVDKFLVSVSYPASEEIKTYFIQILKIFVESQFNYLHDFGSKYYNFDDDHLIVKLLKFLWETELIYDSNELREIFVISLSAFSDIVVPQTFISSTYTSFSHQNNFMLFFGRKIIPFIMETNISDKNITFNMERFYTVLQGTSLFFSDYIQNIPLIKAIRFINKYAINLPQFTLDNETEIIDLFNQSYEAGNKEDCSAIITFLNENGLLNSLSLSEKEIIEFSVLEAKIINRPKVQVLNLINIFLRDEQTLNAKFFFSLISLRNLFFDKFEDIHERINFTLFNESNFSKIFKKVYRKSPTDNLYILRTNIKRIHPSDNSIKLISEFFNELIKNPTTTIYYWCIKFSLSYSFLFNYLPNNLIIKIFDISIKDIEQFTPLLKMETRPFSLFKLPASALSFLTSFITCSKNIDLFFKWIFGENRHFTNTQLLGIFQIINTVITIDTEFSVFCCCTLTKYNLTSRLVSIISKLNPKEEISLFLMTEISSLTQFYFSEIIKMNNNKLQAIQYFVEHEDYPFMKHFGDVSFNYMRVSNLINSFGFIFTPTEFQYIQSLERESFNFERPFIMINNNLLNMDQEEEEETIIDTIKSIDINEYKSFNFMEKAKALYSLLPKLPTELSTSNYIYLLCQPNWIYEYINMTHKSLLTPSHYFKLFDIYKNLIEAKDSQYEFQIKEKIIESVICNKELFSLLIPMIGNSEWEMNNFSIIDGRIANVNSLYKRKNSIIFSFLESALSYPKAVMTYIQGFQDVLKTKKLHELIQPLSFVAVKAINSEEFRKYFSNEIIEYCLYPFFRNNHKFLNEISKVICKYYKNANHILVSQNINQFIIFLLLNESKNSFDAAIYLSEAISKEDKIEILPFVNTVFEKYKKEDTPESRIRCLKLLHSFSEISDKMKSELIKTLDNLLTKYHPNKISEIGPIIDLLLPRNYNRKNIDYYSQKKSLVLLNIPNSIYLECTDFWDIIAKHQTKITDITRAHPELVSTSLNFVIKYPILTDIILKINLFKSILKEDRLNNKPQFFFNQKINQMIINRTTIVEDSMRYILESQPSQLFEPFRVTFKGEEGVDAGGVTRDWFGSLARELFGNKSKLFVPTANGCSLQVNKSSGTTSDVLNTYKFVGRFVAMSMIHSIPIPAHLTSSLFKLLLGTPFTIRDMEQIDEEIANSMKKIIDEPVEDLMLDFTVDIEEGGQFYSKELKENGSEINITEENKLEYIQLRLDYYFKTYASEQINSFLNGFFEVIPQEKLQMFTAQELDLVICGIPEIDINDLRKNCKYIYPYKSHHKVIELFFNVIGNWNSDDIARLLQFVTGSSQVPVGGFATLTSQGRPFTIAPGGDSGRLPAAHVCTNQLDLPEYETEESMNTKLLCAIRNCLGFGKA